MKTFRYQCLTPILLVLVVLVYFGGVEHLRPVYDALRRFRLWGVR